MYIVVRRLLVGLPGLRTIASFVVFFLWQCVHINQTTVCRGPRASSYSIVLDISGCALPRMVPIKLVCRIQRFQFAITHHVPVQQDAMTTLGV